jgi:hypothetical protein
MVKRPQVIDRRSFLSEIFHVVELGAALQLAVKSRIFAVRNK